jgi:hypothetical protein
MAGMRIGWVIEPRFLNVLGRLWTNQTVSVPLSGGGFQQRPTEPQPRLNSWVPQTPGVQAHLEEVEMDVYTGVLSWSWTFPDHLIQTQVRTFLPVGPGVLKDYGQEAGSHIVDFTATATPSVVAPVEDEANFFGVDGVPDVQMVVQPQLVGDPRCLVMTVALAGLNVTIHRITYQVTVLVGGEGSPPVFFGQDRGVTSDTEPQ